MPTDLRKLQGSWDVTALEVDGQAMSGPALEGAAIVVTGTRFESIGAGEVYEGELEVDQACTPKAFDLVFTAGPEQGNRNPGIYTLDGDRWTICLSTRGGSRPVTFATAPDTGLALETLQRSAGATRKRGRTTAASASYTPPPVSHQPPSGPPTVIESDSTVIEGDWEMLSAVFNGVPLDPSMVAWARRITRGNLTSVMAGAQTMLKATFSIDEAAHPATIDYMNLHGQAKGRAQAGIYAITGEVLSICMSAPGKPRPADFSSLRGDGRSYTTWRRVPT